MKKKNQLNSSFQIFNNFVIFQTKNGKVNIDVFFKNNTLWLTQKKMGELFEVDRSVITKHIKNVFESGELEENAVCAKFAHTAEDGKTYQTTFYNLKVITATGYRVNSHRAMEFRKWATEILHEYIIKGFAMDDERLKQIKHFGQDFFATVQNKLHWAIAGKTAAEIIYTEVDARKVYMGLKTWKQAPKGKISKLDVAIAKNYLNQEHLEQLERIVSAYLDLAENRARRHIVMNMKDWVVFLDKFLAVSDYSILTNAGKITALEAKIKAEAEYEKYRVEQDKNYISDFDREVKKILEAKNKRFTPLDK